MANSDGLAKKLNCIKVITSDNELKHLKNSLNG
jgi:hypothetical protein